MAAHDLGRQVGHFVRDIKLEHSVFALPFALLGLLLGTRWQLDHGLRESAWPTVAELGWILVAMIGARSAAMGFNRLVDARLDARNPRTMNRPLAAGEARADIYLALITLGALTLVLAAAQLNPLALLLSPVALTVLFGYSLLKRVTDWCHFGVGLSLAIAPLAAWVGICGILPPTGAPYYLALAVLFWVGGFDILYATLDLEFDRAEGVHSLPARYGVAIALQIARVSHLLMVLALLAVGACGDGLAGGWWLGVGVSGVVLAYEHAIVRPDDLGRVNTAFFTLNGVLGLMLLVAGGLDLLRP